MKAIKIFVFAALLTALVSCSLVQPGPDGGPSPLLAGGEAAVKTLVENSPALFSPGGWITVLITAAGAAGAAIVTRHQTIKKLKNGG